MKAWVKDISVPSYKADVIAIREEMTTRITEYIEIEIFTNKQALRSLPQQINEYKAALSSKNNSILVLALPKLEGSPIIEPNKIKGILKKQF